jgi:alpha-L-arabinofuranosidase
VKQIRAEVSGYEDLWFGRPVTLLEKCLTMVGIRCASSGVDLVDEHYYMSPKWFLSNANRYDKYSRKGPKVFAGEYAAHGQGEHNNWEAALSEAAFMTGLERNADVVYQSTYAPLFAHIKGWQWKPDLIWFDNLKSLRTVNWYVQMMYGTNKGTDVLRLTENDRPSGRR